MTLPYRIVTCMVVEYAARALALALFIMATSGAPLWFFLLSSSLFLLMTFPLGSNLVRRPLGMPVRKMDSDRAFEVYAATHLGRGQWLMARGSLVIFILAAVLAWSAIRDEWNPMLLLVLGAGAIFMAAYQLPRPR